MKHLAWLILLISMPSMAQKPTFNADTSLSARKQLLVGQATFAIRPDNSVWILRQDKASKPFVLDTGAINGLKTMFSLFSGSLNTRFMGSSYVPYMSKVPGLMDTLKLKSTKAEVANLRILMTQKANASDLNALGSSVTNLGTLVGMKAYIDSIYTKPVIENKLSYKANLSDMVAQFTATNTAVGGKANAVDVTTQLNTLNTLVNSKAATTDVNAQLAATNNTVSTKATTIDVNAQIAALQAQVTNLINNPITPAYSYTYATVGWTLLNYNTIVPTGLLTPGRTYMVKLDYVQTGLSTGAVTQSMTIPITATAAAINLSTSTIASTVISYNNDGRQFNVRYKPGAGSMGLEAAPSLAALTSGVLTVTVSKPLL